MFPTHLVEAKPIRILQFSSSGNLWRKYCTTYHAAANTFTKILNFPTKLAAHASHQRCLPPSPALITRCPVAETSLPGVFIYLGYSKKDSIILTRGRSIVFPSPYPSPSLSNFTCRSPFNFTSPTPYKLVIFNM
jgi:hypothetical protein